MFQATSDDIQKPCIMTFDAEYINNGQMSRAQLAIENIVASLENLQSVWKKTIFQ